MNANRLTGLAVVLSLVFCSHFTFASFGGGSVMGRVMDPSNNTPDGFVTVVFECQGVQHEFTTNEKGFYYASNIPPGIYNVTAGFMSKTVSVIGLKVRPDDQQELNFDLTLAVNALGAKDTTGIVIYSAYGKKGPLIDPFGDGKYTLTIVDIKEMPVANIGHLTEQQSGVTAINGQFYVHGARSDGLVYYIDQCRVMGNAEIPLTGLDTYTSYTGFIPVKYGDATGGVVVMETRSYFTEQR